MKNGNTRLEPHTKGMAKVLIIGVLVLFLAVGSGCGYIQGFFGGEEDKDTGSKVTGTVAKKEKPKKPATSAKPQPSKEEDEKITLEKLQEIQKEQENQFTLNPQLMHDPFTPLAVVDEKPPPPPEELPPLQKLELSQIKLVAVVIADEKTRALVEDSTGMGYIIRMGTEIGPPQKNGKVIEIEPDKVVIAQETKDYMGNMKEQKYELKLHPIEGEKK